MSAQFGNKPPKDLRGEEKARYLRALNDAQKKVLAEAGVGPGSWALYQRRHGKELTAAKTVPKGASGPAADTVEIVTGDGAAGGGDVVIEHGSPTPAEKKSKR